MWRAFGVIMIGRMRRMTEPITTTAGAALGIKIGPAFAGMLGATMSMRAVAHLRWYERALAMIHGAGASAYIAPAIARYFSWGVEMENAAAFLIGVVALNITAGMIELTRGFSTDPWGTIRRAVSLRRWARGVLSDDQHKASSGAQDGREGDGGLR